MVFAQVTCGEGPRGDLLPVPPARIESLRIRDGPFSNRRSPLHPRPVRVSWF